MAPFTSLSTWRPPCRPPVVFVCENNLYATSTPLVTSTPQHPASPAAPPPTASQEKASTATTCWPSIGSWKRQRKRAREGLGTHPDRGPHLSHGGSSRGRTPGGTPIGPREEIDRWKRKCPILRLGRRLTRTGTAGRDRAGRPGSPDRVEDRRGRTVRAGFSAAGGVHRPRFRLGSRDRGARGAIAAT